MASTLPSGLTTLAWPGKRSRPSLPTWLADTHTTWFSTARAWSSTLKWRVWTSRPRRRVLLSRQAGQAAIEAMISAPSSDSLRAASGKTLS